MAGPFSGALIGNVGAMSGANTTPWLQMQQMLDQRTEFERSMEERMAERQQAEQLALSQLEFNRQAELARQQMDQQRLAQGAQQFQTTEARLGAGQQQQGELARLGIAQDEQARADANRRYLESLKRDEGKETRAREERETVRSEAKTREETERERIEAEKQRPAEAKAWTAQAIKSIEQENWREWNYGVKEKRFDLLRERAMREFSGDAEQLATVLAGIDAMEQEDRQREYEDIKLGEARAAREGRERANEGKIDYQRLSAVLERLETQLAVALEFNQTDRAEKLQQQIDETMAKLAGD